MKKLYIQPSLEEYKIETMGMLALSTLGNKKVDGDDYAPSFDFDDEDYDEE